MAEEKKKKRIAIIGGGASGMTAAIFASAAKDVEITIFEAKDVPGKKINGTGNGKCNFTNDNMDLKFYRGQHPEFASFALSNFDNETAKDYFKSMGIRPKEKNGGYIYPNSEEAASVSSALRLSCAEKGVKFVFEKAKSITKEKNSFKIDSQSFDKVIIACGSFANMKDVTDFNGYGLVKSLGHKITPLYPALCQIRCKGSFFKTINGVRTEGSVKVFADGKEKASEKGELLFTDYGVSGIPAFQVSRFCAEAAGSSKKVVLSLNFMAGMSVDEVRTEVENRLKKLSRKGRTNEEAMLGLLNHKLNFVLLNLSGIDPTGSNKNVTDDKIAALVKNLTDLRVDVTGTNDFSFAQVVAGGTDTSEVDPETMGSKIVQGLYFAGETLDIDGTCGGYNLQWAWSSGAIAGLNAAFEKIPKEPKRFIEEIINR
ncbi:MAG: aminoacetone oxidase family FAD-binding enzyme [Lachnospiraceae bacterium]|nr:aminoacetone oxidase family FAD-binding enzyme [Lachnospiraceae bacterium]